MNKHYLISPFTYVVFKLFSLIIFPSFSRSNAKADSVPLKAQDGDREEEKGPHWSHPCPDIFQMGLSSLVITESQLLWPTSGTEDLLLSPSPSLFKLTLNLKVLVAQSYPTLCDTVDCSPPGSSVHGILQARILEWVIILFSKGSSWLRDWTQVSCFVGSYFTVWYNISELFFSDVAPGTQLS